MFTFYHPLDSIHGLRLALFFAFSNEYCGYFKTNF